MRKGESCGVHVVVDIVCDDLKGGSVGVDYYFLEREVMLDPEIGAKA